MSNLLTINKIDESGAISPMIIRKSTILAVHPHPSRSNAITIISSVGAYVTETYDIDGIAHALGVPLPDDGIA